MQCPNLGCQHSQNKADHHREIPYGFPRQEHMCKCFDSINRVEFSKTDCPLSHTSAVHLGRPCVSASPAEPESSASTRTLDWG